MFDSRHGHFFFFNDDGGASCKALTLKRVQSTKPKGAKSEGSKRPSRSVGMSAANVGASIIYLSTKFP